MAKSQTLALEKAYASDHKFIGIRPADATPNEAPCILLDTRNATGLAEALIFAGNYWQGCDLWAVIASDQALALHDDAWPPRMFALRMPTQLTTFTTTRP